VNRGRGYKKIADYPIEVKEEIMQAWPSFESLQAESRGVVVLSTLGDIILATAPHFRAALQQAVDAVERKQTEGSEYVLLLNLSETEFMDSVGLTTLLEGTKGLREQGGEVRLVSPSRQVMRTLEVTGILEVFRVYGDMLSATEKPANWQ
jgi:anti-sigma B factor antagonist